MTAALQRWRANPVGAGLLPLLLAAFLFLMLRNAGIYPIVFIDEWVYSSGARLVARAEAMVPSYVYFALFRLTNRCGDSFMECNRLLNAVLFVGAAPFIYLLARRVAAAWVAVLVALAAVLAPANALTPYFMPEAAYYFAFWVMCHAAFRVYERRTAGRAMALGALVGIGAMVKMHTLFLLPSFLLFVAFATWTTRAEGGVRGWLRSTALLWAALLGAAAVARFGLGRLLAGKPGMHLFGELYSGQIAYTSHAHLPYDQLAQLALANLGGQLMILTLLFGVPLAMLAVHGTDIVRGRLRNDPAQAMAVLTLLLLGALIAVTVGFTTSITGLGAQETASRIHTRYYNFALPLLVLCAAAGLSAGGQPGLRRRAALGVLALAGLACAQLILLQRFTHNIIDAPELRTLALNPQAFRIAGVLAAVALAGWIVKPLAGARLFLYLFLPATTLYMAKVTAEQVRQSIYPDPYSKAGLFVRHYLTKQETGRMALVADDMGGLHRARFFIDDPAAQLMLTAPGTVPDWSKLPAGKSWVLTVGKYALPPHARIYAQKDDMTLAQVGALDAAGQRFDFSRPLPAEYVQRIDGLSPSEPWGARFGSTRVAIQFELPLPKRLALSLDARAFDAAAAREIQVAIGGQRQSVRLDGARTNAKLVFDTDGTSDNVEFTVLPRAGAAADAVPDDVGLEALSIEAAPGA